MKRICLLLFVTCFSVLAQQETKDQSPAQSVALAEARKAIDKGNAQWVDAWDKSDASLIAALFAKPLLL